MTTILEKKILGFTDAVKRAIENENWYAALAVSLTLPDICGKLQDENLSSNKRYVKWFNEYLKKEYTSFVGADRREHQFLTGEDMYALRCSYLHAGEVNIESQWIRKVLKDYKFVAPDKKHNNFIHRNQINDTLQLQVDQFCLDVCKAIESWVEDFKNDVNIQHKAEMMIDIVDISGDFSL
jgi:hypothetical protein